MNQLYLGLGLAILGVIIAIAWLVSTRRVTVSATPQPPQVLPMLQPSDDQRVRDIIAPVFNDMIDKEHAKRVSTAMYEAYKGVKLDA